MEKSASSTFTVAQTFAARRIASTQLRRYAVDANARMDDRRPVEPRESPFEVRRNREPRTGRADA
jgi:hypothetical protein